MTNTKTFARLAALFLLLFSASFEAIAGVAAETIREATEAVLRNFGKEATEMSSDILARQIADAGTRFGDDGLRAISKIGPRTFGKLTIEAGEHAPAVVKLTAKYGNDAVWVVSKPRSLAIFVKYGEESARAIMKHPNVAEGAIEQLGKPAARALNAITAGQARRLGIMVEDGAIKRGAESAKLLDVVARYGDKAMEFVWKNKGALAVTSGLIMFLNNPEPFIQGVRDLGVEIAKPVGIEVARGTNWTSVVFAGLVLFAALAAFRVWIGRRHIPPPS